MCLKLFYSKIKILKGVEIEIMIVPQSTVEFGKKRKGQEFSSLKNKYIYNKKTGELELAPIQEDLQELIDSYADTALDKVLEKFSGEPVLSADRKAVYGYAEMKNDLADIANIYDKAEYYREKFGLSPDLSVSEIYEKVNAEALELGKKLKEKGVMKNVETQKVEPKKVETPVQEHGEENAQA